MFIKVIISAFLLLAAKAYADCGVKSYFPTEPTTHHLIAGKVMDIKTKHYFAIANESSTASSYKLCGRIIMKGSVDGNFFKEECKSIGLKGFKGHTEIVTLSNPVKFIQQGQLVDLTIDTWIEGMTCKPHDIFRSQLPVFSK